MTSAAGEASAGARLAKGARREVLLDAAAQLLSEGSLEDVTMESVAAAATVSRPLVYKHFASRDELLAALYRREAADLHEAMAKEVAVATSLEGMFRGLVHGALRAAVERGPLFAQLRAAGAWTREVTREQRARDADTAKAFIARAKHELGLDGREAAAAIGLLLGMIDQVLAQFRAHPTPARADLLEETYLTIVRATLAELAQAAP